MSYLKRHGTRRVPQWAPLPDQAANSAGGFAWAVDIWTRLRRFLVLGSEGGSYYASEWKLTRKNAKAVERCVLASEYHDALRVFREPPFAVAASGAEIGALYRAVLLRRVPASVPYRTLSVPLRHRGLPVPTRAFVAAARGLGCPVHVWTVDDAATARTLWGRGVAGMVTNMPAAIREEREK